MLSILREFKSLIIDKSKSCRTKLFQRRRNRTKITAIAALIILAVGMVAVVKEGGGSGFADKSIWDWLDLLIIPLVLAMGALWFNKAERKADREAAEEKARLAREIEKNRQQQETLSTYLDRMADLLINCSLRASAPDSASEVRTVARARTLSTLRWLDPNRVHIVINFLLESRLMTREFKLVDLNELDLTSIRLFRKNLETVDFSHSNLQDAQCIEVDFTEANFSHANLEQAYFSQVNFNKANFEGAILKRAFFISSNLTGANFDMANLEEAHIDGTTILPDGTKTKTSGPLPSNLVDIRNRTGADSDP